MQRFQFVAYGVPQPKGSTRAFVPKGWTRAIVTSDNPRNKGWQQTVAEAASSALERLEGPTLGMMLEGPLELNVVFYMARPKALLTKRKAAEHIPHTKKPDLDKLVRAVKDALTKVIWTDDAQVVSILARKFYSSPTDSPRAEISVSQTT